MSFRLELSQYSQKTMETVLTCNAGRSNLAVAGYCDLRYTLEQFPWFSGSTGTVLHVRTVSMVFWEYWDSSRRNDTLDLKSTNQATILAYYN